MNVKKEHIDILQNAQRFVLGQNLSRQDLSGLISLYEKIKEKGDLVDLKDISEIQLEKRFI